MVTFSHLSKQGRYFQVLVLESIQGLANRQSFSGEYSSSAQHLAGISR